MSVLTKSLLETFLARGFISKHPKPYSKPPINCRIFSYQEEAQIPLTGLTPPHYYDCPNTRPGFVTSYICRDPLYVQWVEVGSGCSFLFNLWNFLQSLFKVFIINNRWILFNDLRWEMTVRFVDIFRIVDHHCLN